MRGSGLGNPDLRGVAVKVAGGGIGACGERERRRKRLGLHVVGVRRERGPEVGIDLGGDGDALRDLALEREMAAVQTIVKLGRQLRVDNDLKVRQPLAKILVAGAGTHLDDLILDELNIKEIAYIADETALCDVSYKANFKTLGRKCGPKMKAVAAGIAALKAFNGSATVEGFELTDEDVLVTRRPKSGMVVASEGAVASVSAFT